MTECGARLSMQQGHTLTELKCTNHEGVWHVSPLGSRWIVTEPKLPTTVVGDTKGHNEMGGTSHDADPAATTTTVETVDSKTTVTAPAETDDSSSDEATDEATASDGDDSGDAGDGGDAGDSQEG